MENYQPPVKQAKLDPASYFLRSAARANEQELSLLDINDHCIFKIFHYLDDREMSIIADTNKRLRALAKDYFRLKRGKVHIAGCEKCTLSNWPGIFRNFGQFISDLEIYGGDATDTIFKLTEKYCKPTTLTHLHLNDMILNEYDMKPLTTFFESLEYLEIYDSTICECCMDEAFFVFPETFKRLRSLELSSNLNEFTIKRFLRNNFRQLEKICFCHKCEVNHDDFCHFIRRHPNLKILSFIEENVITSETIKFIGDTLAQLEEFELFSDSERDESEFCQSIAPFGSIKTLKKLTLDCNHCSTGNLFESFVANNIAIDYLYLININLNEKTQKALKRLQTIRTLIFDFDDYENTQRYISIAECLPLLSEFHLESFECDKPISGESMLSLLSKSSELSVLQILAPEFTINDRVYSNMLDIIKNRHNDIGLEIRVWKGSLIIDDKFKANQKWIRITEREHSKTIVNEDNEESDGEDNEEADGEANEQ